MCKCENCKTCSLNPEPTDLQRATWRRHHKAGTSPGNPKWYAVPRLPAYREFKPGQKPVYPRIETGQQWRAKHSRDYIKGPDPFKAVRGKTTTAKYVAAYEEAVGLKSA